MDEKKANRFLNQLHDLKRAHKCTYIPDHNFDLSSPKILDKETEFEKILILEIMENITTKIHFTKGLIWILFFMIFIKKF